MTTNITKVSDYSITGTFDVNTSIKAFKDSDEVKQLTLRVHVNQVSLRDIVTKALRPVVIAWQNGQGRSKFNNWINHSTVDIDFGSPGKQVKSRKENIEDLRIAFCKAGVDEIQALELATKAIDNPAVIKDEGNK